MQEHNVDHSKQVRSNNWPRSKIVRVVLGIALVGTLVLGFVAADQLLPKPSDRAQTLAARAGWYFEKSQLRADTRTLAATLRFLLASDESSSTVGNGTNAIVAEHASPPPPRS
jgi:hypothetical protein